MQCPDGGIGRRAGLKHQWIHFHPGSTPGLGTEAEKDESFSPFFFSSPRNSLFESLLDVIVDILLIDKEGGI